MTTQIPPVIIECIEQGIDALRHKARYRMSQWHTALDFDSKNINSDYIMELNKQIEECYDSALILENFLSEVKK